MDGKIPAKHQNQKNNQDDQTPEPKNKAATSKKNLGTPPPKTAQSKQNQENQNPTERHRSCN
jgi:hypothetical protein